MGVVDLTMAFSRAASRIRLVLSLSVAMIVLFAAPSAFAQIKIAVVDLQRAVSETEDGLRAQATLKKFVDRRQHELDTRRDELKRAREDIDKQAKVLSKEALDRRRAEWEQSMSDLQEAVLESNKDLQKEQSKVMQPIINRVQNVLRQVAAQDGYDAILERNAVPYARTDLDITDRVIQRYNAGSGGGTSDSSSGDSKSPKKTPTAPSGKK